MEKEIQVVFESFSLNFQTELELDTTLAKEISSCLPLLAQAFIEYLKGDLAIPKHEFELNFSLVGDDEIKSINSDYRGKNKVTDVLSFPMQESFRNNDYDSFLPLIEVGDLLICHSVCEKQAVEFNLTYIEEFIHLAVHGFLHLCGFDHEVSDEEETLMEEEEKKIILRVSYLRNTQIS